MISNKLLIQLGKEGFFPGPEENEKQFLLRVSYAKKDLIKLFKELDETPPISFDCKVTAATWEWAKSQVYRTYGIAPTWVSAYFSKKKLSPWHGGMTWIGFQSKVAPFCFIQLRKNSYFCSVDEVLAHELAHAVRLMYNDSIYEEFFAFLLSTSKLRRLFGPLIKHSHEMVIFLVLIFVGFVGELFLESPLFVLSKIVALSWLSMGLFRLARLRRRFNMALQNVKNSLADEGKSLALLFRLTDKEILLFSKLSPHEIIRYSKKQSLKSLRWKQIILTYYN